MKDLVELDVYDPMTQRMDLSKLPKMQWSAPMTGEELDVKIRKLCEASKAK